MKRRAVALGQNWRGSMLRIENSLWPRADSAATFLPGVHGRYSNMISRNNSSRCFPIFLIGVACAFALAAPVQAQVWQAMGPAGGDVRALASDIIVMRRGKVVESGEARDVFGAPQNDYTRALFAAAFANEATLSHVVSQ